MIYIWDNGYDCCDHEIVLIESELPWEAIEAVVNMLYPCSASRLIASASTLCWYKGKPATLASRVDAADFFRIPNDPAPDPAAPRLYAGGALRNLSDENAAEMRIHEVAKYKIGPSITEHDGKVHIQTFSTNPIDERFALLTTASAKELIDGWSALRVVPPDGDDYSSARDALKWGDWNVKNFKAECQFRGLL